MRRLSPDFIERVRLANDIVDIIGEDTFLKRSGTRYMGLCPFPSHNEKTPSFSVSPEPQLYHCFGCGQAGNIFTYLREKRNLSFQVALKFLAQRAGISLPYTQEDPLDNSYKKRNQLLKINLSALEFFEEQLNALPDRHPVQRYLKQREISEETVKNFRLGYAPPAWETLYSHLKEKNFNVEQVLQIGLIKRKKTYYDFFRDRLMFPVFAYNGREVLGFGGRTFEEKQPKYINSVDSKIFHKGQIFYGWQNSAPAIREKGKALVVEGYTDYLSLYQRGVKNAVATLGTALTEEHAKWLSRYAERVILCFDGDKAGEKAAERSLNVLLSAGLAPKRLKLEEQDPDAFIREKGPEAFWKKANSAQDLFLDLFLKELKNYPRGVDRLSLIQKIADRLSFIKKSALREYYTTQFLDSFGKEASLVKKALEKALKKKKQSFLKKKQAVLDQKGQKLVEKSHNLKGLEGSALRQEKTEELISLESATKSEIYLLILALENPKYYREIKKSGVIEKINHTGVRKLFDIIQEYSTQELKYFPALAQMVAGRLEGPDILQKGQYPSLKYLSEEKTKTFIRDCLNKVEEDQKHLNLKNITAHMRVDQENEEKYLMKVMEWTKKVKKTGRENER